MPNFSHVGYLYWLPKIGQCSKEEWERNLKMDYPIDYTDNNQYYLCPVCGRWVLPGHVCTFIEHTTIGDTDINQPNSIDEKLDEIIRLLKQIRDIP